MNSPGRRSALVLLRSAAFNVAFFGFTFVCAVLFVPLIVLPRRVMQRAGRVWCAGVLWLAERIAGIGWRVTGLANLPDRPALIAVKHQSAWDTIALPVLVDDPAIFIKRELMRIPFYGRYAVKMGMIPIDRAGGAVALRRMLAGARAALAQGRPVVVFPEGTRTAPGAPPKYHSGIAALYRNLAVPVVPMALNSGLFWGRRAFMKWPGTITISILDPIPPGLDPRQFMAELERRIEGETARLVADALAQQTVDKGGLLEQKRNSF